MYKYVKRIIKIFSEWPGKETLSKLKAKKLTCAKTIVDFDELDLVETVERVDGKQLLLEKLCIISKI